MPEIASPLSGQVALQIQQPNAMTSIGNLLNVGAMGVNIQRSRTALSQEKMDLQERQNLRQLAGNLGQFKNEDGSFNFDGLTNAATNAAPKLGADWAKNITGTIIEGQHAKQAINATDEQTRKQAGGILLGIADSPPEVQTSVINSAVDQYPQLTPAFRFLLNRVLPKATTPEASKKAMISAAKMVMDPGTQQTMGTPSGPIVNTGREQFMVNTQPFYEGGPGKVASTAQPANLVPPTGQEQTAVDALGRPVIQTRSATGEIGFKPPPGSNYRPLMTLPAGETPQTAAPLLQLRDQAQSAAAAVPNQHFNNAQILKLADTAFTGTGSRQYSQILNSIGLKNITGDAAKDTAQLQHFIALQIENNAAAQGANTDAARQLAGQAVLPGDTPGQTIKRITKINDAFATGLDFFNRGIQATLANPNNTKDVFAIRDFQNAWAKSMDPRIFMLENAVKAGDREEVKKIKSELGPEGVKQLSAKARTLQALIHQGAVGGP